MAGYDRNMLSFFFLNLIMAWFFQNPTELGFGFVLKKRVLVTSHLQLWLQGVWLSRTLNHACHSNRLAWFSAAILCWDLQREILAVSSLGITSWNCHAMLCWGCIHIYKQILQCCTCNISKNILNVHIFVPGFYLKYIGEWMKENN